MKRFLAELLLVWLVLAIATPTWAQVAVGTAVSASETGADTAVSVTVNPSGSNRLLACGVNWASGTAVVSSVVCDGLNLTQSAIGQIAESTYKVDVWYRVAPNTGSQTCTATLSVGANKVIGCIPFTGVNQSTPFGTGGSFSDITNPATVTITVPTNGMGVAFNTNEDNLTNHTVDGSSTEQYDITDTDVNLAAIASTKTAAGSAAMTISNAVPTYSAMIALPLNPATARRPIPPIIFQ